MDAKSKDPIVYSFDYKFSIGLPNYISENINKAFNKAWGFEDGNCNKYNKEGELVDKEGADNPEFIEAYQKLKRYQELCVVVHCHKSGKKSFSMK